MTDPKPAKAPWIWMALVIGAQLTYFIYFFRLDLPNTGPVGDRVSRLLLWQYALGWTPEPAPAPQAIQGLMRATAWIERAPIIGYAGMIFLAALGAGAAVLRIVGFRFRVRTPPDVVPGLTRPSTPQASAESLERVEFLVFAFGLGMSTLSLVMLALGLGGVMHRPVITGWLGITAAVSLALLVKDNWRSRPPRAGESGIRTERGNNVPALVHWLVLSVAGLFLVLMLLGAMLPATDFDVREYHLQGPKEFYLAGRIEFSAHNVYANMPFGTEMITLLAMIVTGDWWSGALVGQTVLAMYGTMTALGVWVLARRLFGDLAAWFAALVYVTTPWVFRISVIPYTENALCFYLLAGSLAVVGNASSPGTNWLRGWWIAGCMAGSAAACKYPALISTVLPLGAGAIALPLLSQFRSCGARPTPSPRGVAGLWKPPALFALGLGLTFGPWLAKSGALTGNPMYPLLYRAWGGLNWTPQKNAKWEWSHRVALLVALGVQRPPDGKVAGPRDPQHGITARLFAENLLDVTAKDDRLSPLLFALAPLALVRRETRGWAIALWCLVGYLFIQWWLLTHRLDRFWVPLLPLIATLAGAGSTWNGSPFWRWFLTVVTGLVIFFNLSYCTSSLAGDNRFTMPIVDRSDPLLAPVNWMNRSLPAQSRVLSVGAADLFHLDRPLLYNTVFDDSIFEQLVRDQSPDGVRDALGEQNITHVYVSWSEVLRYRGTYGYTEFVVPRVFRDLESAGVLVRVPMERIMPMKSVELEGERVPTVELYEVH